MGLSWSGTDKTTVVDAVLDAGCVEVNVECPFRVGEMYTPIHFRLHLLLQVGGWGRVLSDLKKVIDEKSYRKLAGVSLGPAFLAPKVALPLGMQHICVNPVPDTSKSASRHVKDIMKGDLFRRRVLVMADAALTATSFYWAAKHLRHRQVGARVTEAVCIVDFNLRKTRENLRRARIGLISLVTMLDFVDPLVARGKLSRQDAKFIRDWHAFHS